MSRSFNFESVAINYKTVQIGNVLFQFFVHAGVNVPFSFLFGREQIVQFEKDFAVLVRTIARYRKYNIFSINKNPFYITIFQLFELSLVKTSQKNAKRDLLTTCRQYILKKNEGQIFFEKKRRFVLCSTNRQYC